MATAPKISGFIGLIPPFTGDDSLEIDVFFVIADSTKLQAQWTDEIAIAVFHSKRRGSAASFFQRSKALQDASIYGDFKRILNDHFKPKLPLAVCMAQFFELKQERHEKVKTYAICLQNKTQNVFDGTITYSEKSIIVAQFVKGLLPNLKRLVLSHEPKTLEKAIVS